MTVRSPLHLQSQMIPGLIIGIASDARRMPFLPLVVPDIPLISARYAALMAPDVRLAIYKLVDIELHGLRGRNVVAVKIDIVDEVMSIGIDGSTGIRQSLRGEIADQMVVPKAIRELGFPSYAELGGIAA